MDVLGHDDVGPERQAVATPGPVDGLDDPFPGTVATQELQPLLDFHEGWREDGSVEILAGYASIGSRLPVIRIGGDFHDYAGAMRQLKARRGAQAPGDLTGEKAFADGKPAVH